MLEVNKINVFYGDLQALWGVSLKVEKGELISIVGSNGAGKTTTLKTISGILRPASGEIKFMGERIDRLPPHKIVEMGIAHVPEGRGIFPFMSVKENLEIGAYTREARRRLKENLEKIYELFPVLRERENQLAGTLSGGEQQMLAIGRGLMLNPKLLLLDEPSLGLAPSIVQKIFKIIEEIRESGTTVMLVEQNVSRALEISDRAYVLENGRIVLEGKSKDLLHNDHVRRAYLAL